ncbi:hypothetical protein V502_08482 [Pseudogymnoascus sp. VKM F-4520 (FW-2644)]|nr:hypothetical protein V502_08482 [Pseudogymnoascus sp. VKM F-4520 (FW-2644)]
MGRRKIEIRPIEDNRNCSVTFFKRKGGLFKKAHELSVLCSVNVAVIILGNSKKLYEYSSSDIAEILQQHNSYRGAKEHKGPLNFSGNGHWDEKVGNQNSAVETTVPEESPTMPPHFPNQATPQMRQSLFLSPPLQNCAHIQHQHTSKTHLKSQPEFSATRHISSNLAQNMQQATYPSAVANSYDCMPQSNISSSRHSAVISQPQQQSSFQSHWSPVPPFKPQLMHMNEQQRASMSTDFQKPVPQNQQTLQPPQLEQHPEQSFRQAQQTQQQLMFIEPRINLTGQSSSIALQHTDGSHNSAVILPQLSPSSSARLDFAQSNPFVRPPPAQNQDTAKKAPGACRDNIGTPISALPRRFITSDILQSPSSFYPEWSFGGVDGNMLAIPLDFSTPVVGCGPSFLREEGLVLGEEKQS